MSPPAGTAPQKLRITYDEIHMTIQETSKAIREEFAPEMMIAIGGGGFFPARVLRTYLKVGGGKKNIPIQAIGLSLYEDLPNSSEGTIGKEVVRTQWLDTSSLTAQPLVGKRILIVDEVDDSRTTLQYAVSELRKDIESQLAALSEEKRNSLPPTQLGIFVVHNKEKSGGKLGSIPEDVKYFAGRTIGDIWVEYPWEQLDIKEHNRLAAEASQTQP